MELLRHIRAKDIPSEVIIMTGYATLDTAIETMRPGAFDYLLKPFSLQDLKDNINRLLEYRRFLDPAKTMDLYKTIREQIFNLIMNKSTLSENDLNPALTSLNEQIDSLFRFVRGCERFVLVHRDSLAAYRRICGTIENTEPGERRISAPDRGNLPLFKQPPLTGKTGKQETDIKSIKRTFMNHSQTSLRIPV